MTPLETRAGGRELRNAGLRRSLVAETDSPFRSLSAQTTRRSNALTGSAAESRAVSPTTSTSNCKRNVPRTTERPVCVRFQSTGKVEPVAGRERASDGARGKRRCPRPDPSRRLAFVARQLQEPSTAAGAHASCSPTFAAASGGPPLRNHSRHLRRNRASTSSRRSGSPAGSSRGSRRKRLSTCAGRSSSTCCHSSPGCSSRRSRRK
jgi:hypothetical protein